MLSIGEFSRAASLTVKTLRYYHELGILVPGRIDDFSGYRYYDSTALERAAAIRQLKEIGFSLSEIKSILDECHEDAELTSFVEKKLEQVKRKLTEYEEMRSKLLIFENSIKESKVMKKSTFEINEIELADKIICSVRYKGRYDDIGLYLGLLYKKAGRYVKGKPFCLYHDGEYMESNADVEVCLEVRKELQVEGINCRILKGGRAVSLIHRGPYGTQGQSYGRLFDYCNERGLTTVIPGREVYLKGPGMIFKGNPQKYLTELIYMVKG